MKPKINLYPDDEMLEWIKEIAKEQRRSLNSCILLMLDFLKENPQHLG